MQAARDKRPAGEMEGLAPEHSDEAPAAHYALDATRGGAREAELRDDGRHDRSRSGPKAELPPRPSAAELEHQKLGADIIQRALKYPMRLIAANAGDNGSVVVERVTGSKDANFGYNAATGEFQDLMVNGIIDPTKVIRCALENSCSVAKIFLTSDVVVCEIPENEPMVAGGAGAMDNSGYGM